MFRRKNLRFFRDSARKKWPLRGSVQRAAYTVSSCQTLFRRPTKTTSDSLTLAGADLLTGQYGGVDRIIWNAYFPLGCRPGGFRTWWRDHFGNDNDLDNTHLMRWAGRFSRRLRGWAQKNNIPVIDCAAGERKHDLAEQYLPTDPSQTGIFLVLVHRAPAPVWDVARYGSNGLHLKRQHPAP